MAAQPRRLGGGAAHDARAAPLAHVDDAVVAEFSVGPQDGVHVDAEGVGRMKLTCPARRARGV